MGYSFSKSKYVATCTHCPKYAWLDKYKHEEMAPADEFTQSLFANGHRVGDLAQQYFGAQEDVSATKDNGRMDLDTMKARTQEHLDLGTEVIAEASFSYKGFFCSVDILKRNPDGSYDMYEVKSSQPDKPPKRKTSKKHPLGVPEKYIVDAAYQQYVLTHSGVNVNRVYVVMLRRGFVRDSAPTLDLAQYFLPCDVTDHTTARQKEVEDNLTTIGALLADPTEPPTVLCKGCKECDFLGYCGRDIPSPSPFDMYDVDFSQACDMYARGVSFEDAPEELERMQKTITPASSRIKRVRQLQVEYYHRPGDVHVDKADIQAFFNTLTFPIYSLDFETYQASIPEYEGMTINEQVPFQYSLHVMAKPDADLSEGSADIQEYAFLDEEGVDSRRAIAESLVANIPRGACVVAFNESTERKIVERLANTFPDLAEHLKSFVYRDPKQLFQHGHYYVNTMGKTFSIKSIAPAMFPDDPAMNYHNLEGDVRNGVQAMTARGKLKDLPEEQRTTLIRDLKKYCALDTWALVKIIKKLYEATL